MAQPLSRARGVTVHAQSSLSRNRDRADRFLRTRRPTPATQDENCAERPKEAPRLSLPLAHGRKRGRSGLRLRRLPRPPHDDSPGAARGAGVAVRSTVHAVATSRKLPPRRRSAVANAREIDNSLITSTHTQTTTRPLRQQLVVRIPQQIHDLRRPARPARLGHRDGPLAKPSWRQLAY